MKLGGGVILISDAEDASRALALPSASSAEPSPSTIPTIFSGSPKLKAILADKDPIGDLFGNTTLPVIEIVDPEVAGDPLDSPALLNCFHKMFGEARVHFSDGNDVIIQLQRSLRGTGPENTLTESDLNRVVLQTLQRYEARMRDLGQSQTPTDDLYFTKEDYMFLTPATENATTGAMDAVNELIGMSQLKRELSDLIRVMKDNKRRKAKGLKINRPNLNRIFLGPPGE